ncbi:hypothetical protein [Pseudaestuariivita sp.]|uniref:hypothetical protein n=1 Tax=Pseudaestuariivita sp. TaxID=2211669 RepID=UPI0040598824
MSRHDAHKARIAPLRGALQELFAPDARIRPGHPFKDMAGPDALWEVACALLRRAMPDMERPVFMRHHKYRRIKDGLIRENWVMADILDIYRQLGVDDLARMQDMTGGSRAT